MSDYNPFLEGDDGPLEGSPDDVGEATGDGQPTDQPGFDGPRNYLDVDAYGDHVARIKVDGEEIEVPLKEALQGYSRTADYTRKTQDLASQRQQAEYALTVQRALQAQPEETLRLLSKQYGVPLGQSPPQPWEQPSTQDDGADDPYLDPVERRLNQQDRLLSQMVQVEEQRQADQVLQAAIGGLQRRYQVDDTTVREVISQALATNLGPEAFDMIYRSIAFERAQQTRAQAQADRTAQDQQRRAAGMQASQVIGNGGSANGAGAPMPGASNGPVSIAEAFEAAERQHGVRF